jgi:hypothetical protein
MVKIFLPLLISLSLLGCASTTPNFDQNFGKSLRQSIENQKIKNSDGQEQAATLPWANEYLGKAPEALSGGSNYFESMLDKKYEIMSKTGQDPTAGDRKASIFIPTSGGSPQTGIPIQ